MKSAGIICECNPFHSGHKHLISEAKQKNDAVVCVMSGCFTQRGEAAIADPYFRAEALIRGGADLVLELPYPYSASGADFFASAGVDILSRMGVQELWFGSECGNLERLARAAEITRSPAFEEQYAKTVAQSVGSAEAYFALLNRLCGGGEEFLSNDILGISYLRALQGRNAAMRPITISRKGCAYLDPSLRTDEHPSATALRRRLLTVGIAQSASYLLPETVQALESAQAAGLYPADLSFAERTILTALRLGDADRLSQLAELGGGLGNRLVDAARRSATLEELLSVAATKKYTASKLRRGLLFALTGVQKTDLTVPPAYTTVLAANATGCTLLAEQRKAPQIPTVTRQADVPTDEASLRQRALREAAIALYAACLRDSLAPLSLIARNPVILK